MSSGPPVPPANQPNVPNQPPVDEDDDGFADSPELFLFPGSQIIVDNDTAVRYPVGFRPEFDPSLQHTSSNGRGPAEAIDQLVEGLFGAIRAGRSLAVVEAALTECWNRSFNAPGIQSVFSAFVGDPESANKSALVARLVHLRVPFFSWEAFNTTVLAYLERVRDGDDHPVWSWGRQVDVFEAAVRPVDRDARRNRAQPPVRPASNPARARDRRSRSNSRAADKRKKRTTFSLPSGSAPVDADDPISVFSSSDEDESSSSSSEESDRSGKGRRKHKKKKRSSSSSTSEFSALLKVLVSALKPAPVAAAEPVSGPALPPLSIEERFLAHVVSLLTMFQYVDICSLAENRLAKLRRISLRMGGEPETLSIGESNHVKLSFGKTESSIPVVHDWASWCSGFMKLVCLLGSIEQRASQVSDRLRFYTWLEAKTWSEAKKLEFALSFQDKYGEGCEWMTILDSTGLSLMSFMESSSKPVVPKDVVPKVPKVPKAPKAPKVAPKAQGGAPRAPGAVKSCTSRLKDLGPICKYGATCKFSHVCPFCPGQDHSWNQCTNPNKK